MDFFTSRNSFFARTLYLHSFRGKLLFRTTVIFFFEKIKYEKSRAAMSRFWRLIFNGGMFKLPDSNGNLFMSTLSTTSGNSYLWSPKLRILIWDNVRVQGLLWNIYLTLIINKTYVRWFSQKPEKKFLEIICNSF